MTDKQRCQKCGCETKGEEAWVDGQIWCHPCADEVPLSETVKGENDEETRQNALKRSIRGLEDWDRELIDREPDHGQYGKPR